MPASRSWPLALAALLFLSGCGGESATTVSGAITAQGKPVTTGLINFKSADGKTLGGPINSDGTYSFELPAGEYQVRIDAPGKLPPWKEGEPEPKPVPREAAVRYADYATSGLTATIGGDSSQPLDFPLE